MSPQELLKLTPLERASFLTSSANKMYQDYDYLMSLDDMPKTNFYKIPIQIFSETILSELTFANAICLVVMIIYPGMIVSIAGWFIFIMLHLNFLETLDLYVKAAKQSKDLYYRQWSWWDYLRPSSYLIRFLSEKVPGPKIWTCGMMRAWHTGVVAPQTPRDADAGGGAG